VITRRVLVTLIALVGSSCAPDSEESSTAPADRAATIRTTACGDASKTVGSAVVVDDDTVLTAAHVVTGATDIFVTDSSSAERLAVLEVLDTTRDLAVLRVATVDVGPVETVELDAGDRVQVVGGASSGTVAAAVARRLVMNVDDVRAGSRSKRQGYELDVAIDGGDSGAGVFDIDGGLAGIVFAVPTERSGATFVVGASELEVVLAVEPDGPYRCDEGESRVVATG